MGAWGLCGQVTRAGELAWRRWSVEKIPIPGGLLGFLLILAFCYLAWGL